jgi:HTH-type transcriptional regulator/antitoxin HigA
MLKVINSDAEYEAALAEVERLLEQNPAVGTPEDERLKLLTVLVKDYESRNFPTELPDPIEAIRFRMEQQGLTPRDLMPYLGSRSKVSEVLSGRRPLTISMIRALHAGFGIPAKVLLREQDPAILDAPDINYDRFPIREMVARGWIVASKSDLRTRAEELLRDFFAPLGSVKALAAIYKKTNHVRAARAMDKYALTAWTARVVIQAGQRPSVKRYEKGGVDLAFMREIARLSAAENGPVLAHEALAKQGITLIIEPHLPRTHLDGAAILHGTARPIIGLSLRHDRVDNFWFCLMHELAHLSLHLDKDCVQFYDDLDVESRDDSKEREADDLAQEALIPRQEWERSPASRLRTQEAAEHLAKALGIHPAIVAGRIRHKYKDYRVLNHLVARAEVRRWFPEIQWS